MPEGQASRRWLAAAYRTFLGVVSAYALWLVVVHVFLWTPLLRRLINEHQRTVHLDYHFAWSLFPGTVHASGVVLTVQDHVEQFRLAIDDLTACVLLQQLPARKFHADKVRARGITFAMRRRLSPADLTLDALRGLPLIDGLPTLPLKDPTVDDQTPDARYNIFSVWLEDIQGEDVRVLWFDKLRLEGKAQVAGAFYLKPQREMYIAPGQLRIESASLHSDGDDVAKDVRGELELRVGPLDPRQMKPEKFARAASLTSDLRAHIQGLEFIGAKGGAGEIHVAAQVQKGKLVEGNLIQIDLGETALPPVKAEKLALWIGERHAVVALHEVSTPGARLSQARAELFGDAPDLADLQLPKSLLLDLLGGEITDARALTAKLPEKMRLLGGHGSFAAHIEGPTSQGTGFFKLSLEQLAIDARNETFHTDLALDARIASLDFRRGANLSDTTIDLENGGIKRDPQARLWWGHIKLPRAQLSLQSSEMLDADLVADCRDARPIVGLYARLGSLPGSVKSLFTMSGLHVWGSAAAGKGWVVLRDLHASGDGAEIRAVFRHEKNEEQGAAWLKVGILPLALGLGQNGGGLHILHPGDFFTERKAALGRAPMLLPRKPRPRKP
jgi:hypothetical protein